MQKLSSVGEFHVVLPSVVAQRASERFNLYVVKGRCPPAACALPLKKGLQHVPLAAQA
jgi:hypothetical protein